MDMIRGWESNWVAEKYIILKMGWDYMLESRNCSWSFENLANSSWSTPAFCVCVCVV